MEEIHEKTLTKTDVTQKFTVPIRWLGKIVPVPIGPGSETPLQVVDELGKTFTFWLTVRSKSLTLQNYHSKPELKFKEWHAFVVEKKLKEGESIYFWWDNSVHILRVKVRVRPWVEKLLGIKIIA